MGRIVVNPLPMENDIFFISICRGPAIACPGPLKRLYPKPDTGAPPPNPAPYRTTCDPSSTTRFDGILKKAVALPALRNIATKISARQ